MDSCETCLYRVAQRCCRYPPKIIAVRSSAGDYDVLDTDFPTVNLTWWCGEFSKKTGPNVTPVVEEG